jgi:NADPH:quinone reductase-like Zn-dependent oxidoreductase
MRAVKFDNYGGLDALHLTEVETPKPGPGQFRLRVVAAGVNPADGKWRSGMFKDFIPIPLPHIPGYDVAGLVDEVGPGVDGFKKGDRVAALLGNTTHGGYAEYAICEAAASSKVPEGIDLVVAAALPVASLTAAQMIEEHIKPSKGETILITGALGAVGRFLVHEAKKQGLKVIAAVRPAHAAEAKQIGASETIPLEGGPRMTFDHVADTIGGPAVAILCRTVKAGGRICTAATDPIDPAGLPATPTMVFLHQDGPRLAQVIKEVATGTVPVPIARRMPLAAAAEAQKLVAAGGLGGKIILEP